MQIADSTARVSYTARALPRLQGPIALALLLGAASPVAAQVVQGTVVEQGTERRVTGGFIVLLDETGTQQDADLTDAAGRFRLDAPSPGVYRLGLDRIGYLSVTTAPFGLAAGQSIEYRLAALVEPVELSGIDVRIESECWVRPGEELAVARAWEEARKALNATAWTLREGLLAYTVVGRERRLDPYSLEVRDERTRRRRGVSRGSPYVAIDADLLASEGYAKETEEGRTYYAPDAATILSDSFLDRHCFRLLPSEESEPGRIGLAFEPVDRGRRPDIEGTIWLDEETAELLRIDFDYTGLPEEATERAGGTVEFEPLATGEWIVRRWRIRMPVVRPGAEGVYSHLTMDPASRRAALVAIEEDSGEIERVVPVRGQDGVRAARRLESEPIAFEPTAPALAFADPCSNDGSAVVTGVVSDAEADVPLPGARVEIGWGGSRPGSAIVVADAAGLYEVCGVAAGVPLTVIALFPQRRSREDLTLPEGTREFTLDLEATGTEAVEGARIGSEIALRPGPAGERGSLAGEVRDAVSGEPLAAAQLALPELGTGAVTDAEGRFRLEIPPGRHPVAIEFLGYETAETEIESDGGALLAAVRLVPSPIAMAALEVEIEAPERLADRARGESRYVMTSSDIPTNTTLPLGQLLARRMPGLRHDFRGSCSVLRTRNGVVGLVVLDDQRIHDTCVLNMIRPEDIERVEFLPSLAASLEFGEAAGGGVLIVRTRHGGS